MTYKNLFEIPVGLSVVERRQEVGKFLREFDWSKDWGTLSTERM